MAADGVMRILIAGCESGDEERLVITVALDRARAARAGSLAERLAAIIGRERSPAQALDTVGASVRASLTLEGLLAPCPPGSVQLGPFLDRFATLRAIASGLPMTLRTSVADVTVEPALARCVALALCEVIQLFETDPHPDIMVAVEPAEGLLFLAVAAVGGDEHPVPSAAGAAALRRAERLARTLGGDLVRGVRDGMMLVGVTLGVTDAPAAPPATRAAREPR